MFLSQVYDTVRLLCGNDAWQVDYYYLMIAWSYETGNWMTMCCMNKPAYAFYCFCNNDEAKKLIETQDYSLYEKIVAKRQVSGEVAVVYLVCGSIMPQYVTLFKSIMRKLGVKKIVYFKTKTKQFYMLEV